MKHLQLIRLLVGRELTLRYKRSVIGIGWTLLNPMLTSFVLWVVFSFVFAGKLPDGQQYAPYLMAGIVLNSFFNQGLMKDLRTTTNLSNLCSPCRPCKFLDWSCPAGNSCLYLRSITCPNFPTRHHRWLLFGTARRWPRTCTLTSLYSLR